MGNEAKLEILRENQKEMLEIKTLTEMRNAFDGLVSRLDTADEEISELEDVSFETSKAEKQTLKKMEKNKNNKTESPKGMGQLQKV